MHLQRNQRQELKRTDIIKCGMTTRGFYLSQMNSSGGGEKSVDHRETSEYSTFVR